MNSDAKFEPDVPLCPAYTLSHEELRRTTFLDFVQDVFSQHPHLPMFKIVPPAGWKPTQRRPNMDALIIETPIQQNVLGQRGCYRCVLVEQQGLTAAEFQAMSNSADRLPPSKCRHDYVALERCFWKSVTFNAPLYGADTPMSLFNPNLNGWSLAELHDLLKQKRIENIPGVTSPMTYFGMWKSFFAWHVEDADLYSVNFLHWGAPKIWYCVSPKDKARFEQLAQTLQPEASRRCRGFLRHKDILISPTLMKQYGVPYQMCKQNEGEYVVLNAAAYHSGFNCGFNTAEAVNFATEQWIEHGRAAIPCACGLLRDQVVLDIRLFMKGNMLEAYDSSDSDSEEDVDAAPDTPKLSQGKRASADADTSQSGESATGSVLVTPSRARKGRKATDAAAAKPSKRSKVSATAVVRKSDADSSGPATKGRAAILAELAALQKPVAILKCEDDVDRAHGFELAIPLEESGNSTKKMVTLQCLRQGKDGLYRPRSEVFEELRSALVPIRTQLLDPGTRKPGFKLLTLRSRILNTELV